MTVSPAKLRNAKDLQLSLKEDASAVSTERTSCSNSSVSMNAGIGISKSDEESGIGVGHTPSFFSKSLEAENKKCSTTTDDSGTGGYTVNLDIIRPGDSEFD